MTVAVPRPCSAPCPSALTSPLSSWRRGLTHYKTRGIGEREPQSSPLSPVLISWLLPLPNTAVRYRGACCSLASDTRRRRRKPAHARTVLPLTAEHFLYSAGACYAAKQLQDCSERCHRSQELPLQLKGGVFAVDVTQSHSGGEELPTHSTSKSADPFKHMTVHTFACSCCSISCLDEGCF